MLFHDGKVRRVRRLLANGERVRIALATERLEHELLKTAVSIDDWRWCAVRPGEVILIHHAERFLRTDLEEQSYGLIRWNVLHDIDERKSRRIARVGHGELVADERRKERIHSARKTRTCARSVTRSCEAR